MSEHTGLPAVDLHPPPRERHGIERLRWLQEPDPRGANLQLAVPHMAYLSEGEVQIEIGLAVIEELHDALDLGLSVGMRLNATAHALITVLDRLTPEGVTALVRALKEASKETS